QGPLMPLRALLMTVIRVMTRSQPAPRLSPLGRGRNLAPARLRVRGLVTRIQPLTRFARCAYKPPSPQRGEGQKATGSMSLLSRSCVIVLMAALPTAAAEPPKFTSEQVAFYEKDVRPLLKQHCLKCHGAEAKIKGDLNLTTRGAILAGGENGPVYDPKNPAASRLLKGLDYSDPEFRMPPKGKLADKDIATLTKWVKEGLPFPMDKLGAATTSASKKPRGGVVTEEARRYWAYQPVKRPAITTDRNPIDA